MAEGAAQGIVRNQTLLKSYISESLRRDEAEFSAGRTARLVEALKRRGVSEQMLEDAACEVA